jgi:hypothetical protein
VNVREFLTVIGFKADTHGAEQAEHALHHLQETVEDLKEKLEFLAAAEIVHKLYEVAEQFAHWGEELKVMSENMGVSTDELQRLNIAAERSGVASEEMTTGLARLSRQLYEAKNGSKEAAAAFQKAGISSDQIARFRTAKDALYALADRMNATKDPIARMGQAQELLGRGGFRMVAFLAKGSQAMREQGSEAEKLGLILSEDQVEALEKVEHSFQRFHGLLRSIAASIAAYIAPAFTFVIDKFIEFYNANKNIISTNIQEWLHGVGLMMAFVAGLIVGLIERMLKLAKSFNLDTQILKLIAGFSGLVTGISAFFMAMKLAGTAVGIFSGGFSNIISVFTFTKNLFISLPAVIARIVAWFLALDAAAAPAIVTAFGLAAALGGLVAVAHDLYAVLVGKDTWIGDLARLLGILDETDGATILGKIKEQLSTIPGFSGAFDWVSNVTKKFDTWLNSTQLVKKALDAISEGAFKVGHFLGIPGFEKTNPFAKSASNPEAPTGAETPTTTAEKVKNFLGGGSTGVASLPDRVGALSSPEKALGGATNVTNVSGGTQNYNMNITMPINVPAGTNIKDVSAAVKEMGKEHLEYIQRTIQRSTASPVEY